MVPELNVLLWSTLLALGYLFTHATILRLQIGLPPENANRDHDPEPNVYTARGIRAFRNYLETYPVFIALVVVIALSGKSSAFSEWGAWIWFAARVAYLPAYVIGLGRPRSAIWMVSISGLGLMVLGAFGY